jgi:hypothetical protein
MMGAAIFVHAMALLQGVSPDVQQAIQNEVQQELRGGRFRAGPPIDAGIIIPIALFAMVVLLAWLAIQRKRAEMQARAEFQKQILDKFGSGKELAEFLGSEGSQRFLENLSARSYGGRDRVLGGMRAGIVLAALGLGFVLLATSKHQRDLLVPGVLLLAVGAGLLIAAATSHRLLKKWEGGAQGAGQPLPRN